MNLSVGTYTLGGVIFFKRLTTVKEILIASTTLSQFQSGLVAKSNETSLQSIQFCTLHFNLI
ncbi:MAG: hypothetical protein AB2693_17645, partial [Candidatus Thiodiazotropha sp.]